MSAGRELQLSVLLRIATVPYTNRVMLDFRLAGIGFEVQVHAGAKILARLCESLGVLGLYESLRFKHLGCFEPICPDFDAEEAVGVIKNHCPAEQMPLLRIKHKDAVLDLYDVLRLFGFQTKHLTDLAERSLEDLYVPLKVKSIFKRKAI